MQMKLRRHRQIQELLRERGECSVEVLAQHLGVSDMTVRRDLQQLATEQRLVRTYGGAAPIEQVSFEFKFLRGMGDSGTQKEAIGQAAAGLIEDGQSVLFDSGTTTLAVARRLIHRKRLVVITTSLPIAATLQRSADLEIILLGGIVRRDAPDLAGPLTEANLEAFHADLAFIGADGVGLDGELFNASLTVGRMLAKMTARAAGVYIVADSSKIGRTALCRFGNLRDCRGLITDSSIAPADRAALEAAGVRVIVAEPSDAVLTPMTDLSEQEG
ncbi:MAG: DeoR/GlpR family DNA-binding transcription regulator [Tepidisphaeraceae bacterium]